MKRMIKHSLLFILPVASIFIMSCSNDNPLSPKDSKFSAEEPFSFEIPVASHSALQLEGINGTITITQDSESNSFKIEGVRRVQSESTADAEAHLSELEVSVQDSTDKVVVKTSQPEQTEGRDYIVDYTITLPQVMDVNVHSVNGTITLNDIYGSVAVELVNGDIDSNVTLPLDGTIDMGVANGNIKLDIPKNTSAQFASSVVNGKINVSNLNLQNKVETSKSVSGISGEGRGTINLSTVNGDISVKGF